MFVGQCFNYCTIGCKPNNTGLKTSVSYCQLVCSVKHRTKETRFKQFKLVYENLCRMQLCVCACCGGLTKLGNPLCLRKSAFSCLTSLSFLKGKYRNCTSLSSNIKHPSYCDVSNSAYPHSLYKPAFPNPLASISFIQWICNKNLMCA